MDECDGSMEWTCAPTFWAPCLSYEEEEGSSGCSRCVMYVGKNNGHDDGKKVVMVWDGRD
jgi:hypothetical protein